MTTMVTKERAQELLAAATPGPWEAGAVRVYATAGCPRHAPNADALRGTHCRCRTVTMDAADADRALIAAAPDLAATVVAQADELARLRAELAAIRDAALSDLDAPDRPRDGTVHVLAVLMETYRRGSIADAREIDALRSIVAGRTTPPTRDEVQRHQRAHGGYWLVSRVNQHGRGSVDLWRPMVLRVMDSLPGPVASIPGIDYGGDWSDPWRLMAGATWTPLDGEGRLLARAPVAAEAVAPVTAEVLAAHDRPLVGSEHARTLAVTLAWPEAEVAALIVGLPLAVDDVGSELAVRVRWARRRGALTLSYREHAGVMDALRRRSTGLATGEGVAAAPTDPVDALNAAVTAAILRAERLAREGADATAAYADVARYEAALAALHPADTVEGETAREGVAMAGARAKGDTEGSSGR